MDRFRANFKGSAIFRVPEVIWSHSGRRLLTLERVEGIKVSERERLLAEGYDPKTVAARLVEVMARQVVEHGLFHADPHPGNIFVLPGNVVCLLDYGLVGRVDDDLIRDIVAMAAAVVGNDGDAMVRTLLNVGVVDPGVNLRALKLDLLELIDRYAGLPLRQIDVQALFEQSMAIVRSHQVSVPAELLLLAKAAVLTQATARDLDPEFEPLAGLGPLTAELAAARLTLGLRVRQLKGQLSEVADLLRELPREVRFLLRKLQRNQFVLNFEHRGLERFIDEMDRASNRLSFSLIIAALIIGSSIVLETYTGPQFLGLPLLPLMGFGRRGSSASGSSWARREGAPAFLSIPGMIFLSG
jgi:ubiquinone biosynthesis protein